MTRKVLFLAFDFPPLGGAGVQRSLKFVKYLPHFGWTPTVITAGLGHSRNAPRDETLLDEIPKGIEIINVPFPSSINRAILDKAGLLPSLLRSCFFVWPDIFSPWIKKAVSRAIDIMRVEEHRIIYSTILPLSSGVAGIKLKAASNLPLVTDFRDTITTTTFYDFPTRLHWLIAKHYERLIFRYSSKIIMNTRAALSDMKVRYPHRRNDITCIPNGFDGEDFKTIHPKVNPARFRFVYCGSYLLGASSFDISKLRLKKDLKHYIKKLQFTETPMDRTTMAPFYFFDALARIKREFAAQYKDIEILFIGGRKSLTEHEIKKRNLDDVVTCLGYLPHQDALSYVIGADALILTHLKPLTSSPINTVPGKTYEYLRSHRPIFALIPPGDAHEILEKGNTAIFVSQTNSKEIAHAIINIVGNNTKIRRNPNRSFIGNFDRKKLTEKLANVFNYFS